MAYRNTEKYKKRKKEYYELNREKIIKAATDWNKRNREKVRAAVKRWKENNRDKLIAQWERREAKRKQARHDRGLIKPSGPKGPHKYK